MINKWNNLKERAAILVANLLPRAVAFETFVRVASFEATKRPTEQTCKEAADRWKDPARARRDFMGPAWVSGIEELRRRRDSHHSDPVHEFDGLFYFWDETFTERLGPYSTKERAGLACLEYGKWLQGLIEEPSDAALTDVLQSDPRHPQNMDFVMSMDPNAWAKAFVRSIRFNGTDLAVDEKYMSYWFLQAIGRGRFYGTPNPDQVPVSINIQALDSAAIEKAAPQIGDAIANELKNGSAFDPQAFINQDPKI